MRSFLIQSDFIFTDVVSQTVEFSSYHAVKHFRLGYKSQSVNVQGDTKKGTFETRSGSHVQLAALRNRDLELQTTSPFSNHGSLERKCNTYIYLLGFSKVPTFLCHLYKEIQGLFCNPYKTQRALCGQNAEFINITPGGTHINH
jgi:hypothetical protein